MNAVLVTLFDRWALEADVVTPSGRIYPVDVLRVAAERYQAQPIRWGYFGGPDPAFEIEKPRVKVELGNAGLWCDVNILNTPSGVNLYEVMQSARNVAVGFTVNGSGSVEQVEPGVIRVLDFTIGSFHAQLMPSRPQVPDAVITINAETGAIIGETRAQPPITPEYTRRFNFPVHERTTT